ncbi:TonB family protein [Shewanella sp.]|uniref:energy transducer TonB n=1 Tax=Shewanella sp. TaxID=50422 RepID=UPI003F67E8CB
MHIFYGLATPAKPALAIGAELPAHSMALSLMASTAPVVKLHTATDAEDNVLQQPKPAPEPKAAPKPRKFEPTKEIQANKESKKPPKAIPEDKAQSVPAPRIELVSKHEPTVANHHRVKLEQEQFQDHQPQSLATTINQSAAQPVMLEKPSFKVKPTPPHYPREAKRKGLQGVVLIEVWLDPQGQQIKRIIAKSSGYEVLDHAALDALKEWQFNGHSINGQRMPSRLKVPVRFELK